MAHSVWDNHKLAKDLFIDRDLKKKNWRYDFNRGL
jgi:hypothetical protein